MPYALLILLLVAADQVVKHLVRLNIPLGSSVTFLPPLLDLTYVQNTGAAFSLLDQYTGPLTLVSLVMSGVLAVALVRGFFRHPLGRTGLSLLLAGAVGNLIDRAVHGYVVDMFRVLFVRFAVFNVADICVVTGGFVCGAYYLFFYEKWEPRLREARHDQADADG